MTRTHFLIASDIRLLGRELSIDVDSKTFYGLGRLTCTFMEKYTIGTKLKLGHKLADETEFSACTSYTNSQQKFYHN